MTSLCPCCVLALATLLSAPLDAQQDKLQQDKPPLVPWQRTLEDALAMVESTGKPLLICVNMDGEPASELLAWVNYRDPEFVKLMRGFIPLIVSPDQRSPRDWDDHGRRLPDRRFGRVVNYEHITITPKLADRYFGDRQVAPRHIGVDKDGVLLFDIFLTRSFDPIVEALRKHGKPDAGPVPDPANMSEAALLESPDAGHRDELEARFCKGDKATQVRIASQALSSRRKTQHPEVLRMAVLASAPVQKAAVANIARNIDRAPEWLWLPAFRACGRNRVLLEQLESGLLRLAQTTKDADLATRATNLGLVIQGLRSPSSVVDTNRWRVALKLNKPGVEAPKVEELAELEEELNKLEESLRTRPSAELRLQLAAATLRYARIRILQRNDPSLLLQDACTHAQAAARSADRSIRGRALGVLAWAHDLLEEPKAAAAAAGEALPLLLDSGKAGSPLGAKVLEVFAETSRDCMYQLREANDRLWAATAGQVHAAYEVLIAQPGCSEQRLLSYLQWLQVVGAYGFQPGVLERGLSLFPVSGAMHQYLRYQQLRDWGAESLERTYARMKPAAEHAAQVQWYSGVASLHAAGRHVQNRKAEAAISSYQRAVEQLAESAAANPAYQDSAQHYVCLAEAGLARVLADNGKWQDACASLRKGLAARPLSKDTKDSLGNTPAQNANYIYNRLLDAGQEDQAKGFQEAVSKHGVKVERRAPRGRFRRRRG